MEANRDQKQEIKFRVTSKVAGQKPWSEKWAVKMGDGEEFIVTDEILKFPTHEITGRVVCTFSMQTEKLQFEYRDADRPCSVSGTPFAGRGETLAVTEGDAIEIGEGIRIDVVKAPALPKASAEVSDGPSVPASFGGASSADAAARGDAPIDASPLPEIHVPEGTIGSQPMRPEPTMQSSASIRLDDGSTSEPRVATRSDSGIHPATESRPDERSLMDTSFASDTDGPVDGTRVGRPLGESESNGDHDVERGDGASLSDADPSSELLAAREITGSGEVHQMHTTSTARPDSSGGKNKVFDFQSALAGVKTHLRDTFADRNTRVAAVGALVVMGGVLVWKNVGGSGHATSASRGIAEDRPSGRYDFGRPVQIDRLEGGTPIAEINSRIPQIDALSERLRSRPAPAPAPAAVVVPSSSRMERSHSTSSHSGSGSKSSKRPHSSSSQRRR